MKECPKCRQSYADDSLMYCLNDGTPLIDMMTDEPTLVRNATISSAPTVSAAGIGQTVRLETPGTQQGGPAPYINDKPKASSGGFWKAIAVIVVLGMLGLIALGVGGFAFYAYQRSEAEPVKLSTPSPQPTTSSTANDTDELRDQIAELERLLKDQKKTDKPANIPLNIPNTSQSGRTARVDSPSDGFLALRTLPSSEIGERIVKIPHGASVSVGICGPVMTPVKRSGRWCQATYSGYSGWLFDAYLVY